MVKKIFRNLIAVFLFVFSSNSFAVVAFLESCTFKYIRGWETVFTLEFIRVQKVKIYLQERLNRIAQRS